MSRHRDSAWVYYGSIVLALLLTLLPLPAPLGPLKPFWLGLVVIYWALEAPERMGLGRAFALGLAGDLLSGGLLGEQSLRLVAIAFIVLRLRSRLRFFPMLQQSLAVAALLMNDRVVLLMLRTFASEAHHGWTWWVSPLVGMLAWPWLFLGFDLLRARVRPREA